MMVIGRKNYVQNVLEHKNVIENGSGCLYGGNGARPRVSPETSVSFNR